MDFWQLILLGLVQGLSEFLPISSSGHIVALGTIFQIDVTKLDDISIALHFGTLMTICTVYSEQLKDLSGKDRALLKPLFIGSLPAGIVGIILVATGLNDQLHRADIAGLMLIITGCVLWFGGRADSEEVVPDTHSTTPTVSGKSAFLIGLTQACAILPGLSRSGLTIVTARLLGVDAKLATKFSFFLAIPIICGASLITFISSIMEFRESGGNEGELAPQQQDALYLLLIGVVISAAVGFIALRWLIKLIERGKFHQFAFWCIPLGVILLIYSLYG